MARRKKSAGRITREIQQTAEKARRFDKKTARRFRSKGRRLLEQMPTEWHVVRIPRRARHSATVRSAPVLRTRSALAAEIARRQVDRNPRHAGLTVRGVPCPMRKRKRDVVSGVVSAVRRRGGGSAVKRIRRKFNRVRYLTSC